MITVREAIDDLRAGERDARTQARALRAVKRAASSKARRKGLAGLAWEAVAIGSSAIIDQLDHQARESRMAADDLHVYDPDAELVEGF